MKKPTLDCCYCAFESYKEDLPGLYCNFFSEKIASSPTAYQVGQAIRHNNNCKGFTLLERMRKNFKSINPDFTWEGPSSPVELEE